MIMSGIVEIYLERDGKTQMLDLMTRGSILGFYGITTQDPWPYTAVIRSIATAQVFEISSDLIQSIAEIYPQLLKEMHLEQ